MFTDLGRHPRESVVSVQGGRVVPIHQDGGAIQTSPIHAVAALYSHARLQYGENEKAFLCIDNFVQLFLTKNTLSKIITNN